MLLQRSRMSVAQALNLLTLSLLITAADTTVPGILYVTLY